jgi:hypothetical protein
LLPDEHVCDRKSWIVGVNVLGNPDSVQSGEDGANEAEAKGADDGCFDVEAHLEREDEDEGEGDVDDFEDGVEGDDEGPAEKLFISMSALTFKCHMDWVSLTFPGHRSGP